MTQKKRQHQKTTPPASANGLAGAAGVESGAGSRHRQKRITEALDADAQGSTGTQEVTGFDSYTLADLEAYQTPENHILAGEGIIRRKAGTLFTGGTGLGKSVACTDIAVWLASGQSIFGCIKVHSPVRVLMIEAENDADTVKRDVLSAIKHSHADRDLLQKNLLIQHCWGVNGEAFHTHLEDSVARFKPDTVIVDPYQSFVEPGDLNGTHAFLEWVLPIQRMMHESNFGAIISAHTPKPAQRDSWNQREQVYLAAGSSAISNWARTSMELMTAKQETDRFRLTFGKNAERNGLIDEDGRVVRELYLQHSGNIREPYWTVAANQAAPSKSKYAEDIIQFALSHPSMSYDEIAEKVGCSKGTVSAHYPRNPK